MPQYDLSKVKITLDPELAPMTNYFLKRIRDYTKDHPITGKKIAEGLNVQFGSSLSDIHVRQIVSYLRAELGEPIGSSDKGYYLARSAGELKHCESTMKSRALKILKANLGMMSRFQSEGDQITIFDNF